MVETRLQKRKREELEEQKMQELLKKEQNENRCENCDETLVENIVFINPDLAAKIKWEYDNEDDIYATKRKTVITRTNDPDYTDQEWCLNCHYNWIISENKSEVIDMD